MILLDAFICIGMIVSYLPQYFRIFSLQNSFGFSPNFFLLGSIGVVSTLSNLILLQFYGIIDCFYSRKGINSINLECISNLFAILEIAIQFACFHYLFYLFIHFFPRITQEFGHSTLETTHSNTDPDSNPIGNLEFMDEISQNLSKIWNTTKKNAFFSILYLCVSIILVILALLTMKSESTQIIALVFGLISSFCGIIQFFPQLVYTVFTREIGSLSIGILCIG